MPSIPARYDRTATGNGTLTHGIKLGLALLVALIAGLAASGALSALFESGSTGTGAVAAVAASNPYEPHQLVVDSSRSAAALVAYIHQQTGIGVSRTSQPSDLASEQVLRLPSAISVPDAAARIAKLAGIGYAVPNYIAKAAGSWYPDDPGNSNKAGGWKKLQWNFLPAHGVNAPEAWANLIADHRAGASGIVIAVLDSGVAYRNWGTFTRSPDFAGTKFVAPCDLIAGTVHGSKCTDPYALDRLGHGTFVAGTIAEATNNGIGVTGLAYNATIMPVRVLDADGAGSASTIAAGIRYAVEHHAKVINLSLEFPSGTRSDQIPDLLAAIDYAHKHNVTVVAAAGNDYGTAVDYPAAAPNVIAVGASTYDRCLAAYSDMGRGLTLVAPGGGDDSPTLNTSNCHPNRNLPDVYQMTFPDTASAQNAVSVNAFALQSGWFGTSMASPDVTAAAAMVIASGVIGRDPTPLQILDRLEATARHITGATPNDDYGYGLLNIGAATAKGGPLVPVTTTTITTTTTTGTTTSTTTTGTTTSTTPTTTTTTTTGTTTSTTGTTPITTTTT